MRPFLWTTVAVCALLTVAHAWRLVAESTAVARDPFFVGSTMVFLALLVWALRLLRTAPRG